MWRHLGAVLTILTGLAAQVPQFQGPVVAPRNDLIGFSQELGSQNLGTVTSECVLGTEVVISERYCDQ